MTTVYVTHPRYPEHTLESHPEHGGRIRAVWNMLETTGLAAQMNRVTPEPVTDEQILSVHTRPYLDLLHRTKALTTMVRLDADTYCTPTSFEVARLAAGAAVTAVDHVMDGRAHNGLAAVRPPGHHAVPGSSMGFCLLGNIAIAARHAQKAYGVERVLIVDYDVHHGNGTEAIFFDDPSVMFISLHQGSTPYGTPFYPGTGEVEDTGTGRGDGYTLNIPLPAGHGDATYAALFAQVVRPAARRFQPQLILVSAGFDAHWVDPLAAMQLTLRGYAMMDRALCELASELCGGRIVFVMEGGYNLEALSHGVANIARRLLGDEAAVVDPLGDPDSSTSEASIQPLIARLRALHKLNA